MFDFGPYAILDNVTHHFEKKPEWTWTFKPVTSRDEYQMAKFMREHSRIVDGRFVPPDWITIAWRELAVTFGGTTIPGPDGNPILHPDATVEQVEEVLKEMPLPMLKELWTALGEVNPTWGPAKPPVESEGPEQKN